MKGTTKMKTGDRFIVTTGEYSDYGIRDSFVVLKDFSFDLALARWLKVHGDATYGEPQFGYDQGQSEQDFLAWLRVQCFVKDEKLNEVHLCDYSRPEPTPAQDAGDEPAQPEPATPQDSSG
jgi:hypothetical protein